MIVFNGTYQGYTEDQIDAIVWYYDIEINGNLAGSWGGRFLKSSDNDYIAARTAKDGVFTVSYDVSSATKSYYTIHFADKLSNGNPGDFKPGISIDESIVVNGYKYKLVCYPDAGPNNDGNKYWGCIGLEITNLNEPVISLNLETEGDKVYVVYTCVKYFESEEAALNFAKSEFSYLDIQVESQGNYKIVLSNQSNNTNRLIYSVVKDEYVYNVSVKIPVVFDEAISVGSGINLFFHKGSSSTNYNRGTMNIDYDIAVGDGTYVYYFYDRTGAADSWKRNLVWIRVVPTYKSVNDYNDNSLVVEDGKVYLVITGMVAGYSALTADLQNMTSSPASVPAGGTATINNGTFTLKLDITDVEASSSAYYLAHVFFDGANSTDTPWPNGRQDGDIISEVRLNGKIYQVAVRNFAEWGNQLRRVVKVLPDPDYVQES